MARQVRPADPKVRARQRARKRALQAVYQWQVSATPAPELITQFLQEQSPMGVDVEFFRTLTCGVIAKVDEMDAMLKPVLDRPLEQLDQIERAVLRLGVYELRECPETPFKVVLNEAIELAKTFGSGQGQRYVNGVLDKLAPTLRPAEVVTAG